jgi:small subunit ribosomal protein S14
MKHLLARDIRKRKLVLKNEKNYIILKSLVMNQQLLITERRAIFEKLDKLRRLSKVYVRNRCFLTGRARSISRLLHMTRMQAREAISFGKIIGFKKSSW